MNNLWAYFSVRGPKAILMKGRFDALAGEQPEQWSDPKGAVPCVSASSGIDHDAYILPTAWWDTHSPLLK
jgi:hypothetical protein